MDSVCNICSREYDYKRSSGHRRNLCFYCLTKRFRIQRKKRAIEYKGGKCQVCGYNSCDRALSFHHRNPQQKEFTLSRCLTWAWSRLQKNQISVIFCVLTVTWKLKINRRFVQWQDACPISVKPKFNSQIVYQRRRLAKQDRRVLITWPTGFGMPQEPSENLMFWIILGFVLLWAVNVYTVFWVDRHMLFQRHVKMVKDTMQEELKKIQAEKLSTPGGKLE